MNENDLYRLMTWLSPSFPVSAYAYSHGMEYAVEASIVRDSSSLRDWVSGIVQHGSGRVDSILFCAAFRAFNENDQVNTGRLMRIVELGTAMRGTSETASESFALGQAFLATVRASSSSSGLERWITELEQERQTPTYPIAVAVVCAAAQIPLNAALTAYLHNFATSLVMVGVRLIPLGQTDGQKVVAALEEPVITVKQEAQQCSLDDIGSATPMVDWTSMQHETQYTRLFRS